MTQHTC